MLCGTPQKGVHYRGHILGTSQPHGAAEKRGFQGIDFFKYHRYPTSQLAFNRSTLPHQAPLI
jgi:hypothetical protein